MPDAAVLAEHPKPIQFPLPEGVRMATPRDEQALFDVLMALNEDNSFGIPVSNERVLAAIRQGTQRQGALIGVIEGEDGRIDGTIGMIITQMWYTEQYHLAEQWLFVRPSARNGRIHAKLFEFAEWCRRRMAAGSTQPWIVTTSVSSPKRLAAKLRLWSRFARQVGGIFYIGDLPPPHKD